MTKICLFIFLNKRTIIFCVYSLVKYCWRCSHCIVMTVKWSFWLVISFASYPEPSQQQFYSWATLKYCLLHAFYRDLFFLWKGPPDKPVANQKKGYVSMLCNFWQSVNKTFRHLNGHSFKNGREKNYTQIKGQQN